MINNINYNSGIELARAGMHIFPCHPNDTMADAGRLIKAKSPRISSWRANSSTDENTISRWWTSYPDSLPAIDLGKANMVVVDTDRHAYDMDGVKCFWEFAAKYHDNLAGVPIIHTPSGGFHLYYKQPTDKSYGNGEGSLRGTGINIRGNGGYVIAPVSQSMNGWYYNYEQAPNLLQAIKLNSIPVLPMWVRALIDAPARTDTNMANTPSNHSDCSPEDFLNKSIAQLAFLREGDNRNNALNKAAFALGGLCAEGLLEEGLVRQRLTEVSQENGYLQKDGAAQVNNTITSGLEAGKLQNKSRPTSNDNPVRSSILTWSSDSASKSPDNRPLNEAPRPLHREIPDPSPFPIEALGSVLGGATAAIMAKIQCPDAIAAMSVLGAASLAVQAYGDVLIPATGHAKPLSLFLVTVAASGERKSAADYEALLPIRDFESELRANYDSSLPAYINRLEIWSAEREKIKKAKNMNTESKIEALEKIGPEPKSPMKPIVTCPEPTYEGLCRLYVEGRPALGIFSDEGGQFVGGHGLSADNRLKTISGLSGLWDGAPIKRVRAADSGYVLPGRRLSLHLMMQPHVGATLLSDPVLKDQGFLSRILVAAPTSRIGTRFQDMRIAINAAPLQLYKDRLLAILRLPYDVAQDTETVLAPKKLTLTPESINAWSEFTNSVEHAMQPGGRYETITGFAGKLPEHALRIAGVLCLVENASASCISAEKFLCAVSIAEFFGQEALRLTGSGLISPEVKMGETLRKWLLSAWPHETIGLRAIYQYGPYSIREASVARAAVKVLEEHGWLTRAPTGTTVAGSSVREAWWIVRKDDVRGC